MHSGFEIPGIQHQHPQENSNPTHLLEQIHTLPLPLPTTQQFFLDPHHFQLHYPAYLPVNFKLGLNERNYDGIEDANLQVRGSERLPHTRQSSLGMLHCWQNQQDSTNKQTPFWEPLPEEVSNENSEIVDKQEMKQRETLTTCLDSKVHFGELEAIYNRTESTTQTCPSHPVNAHLPVGSEASIGEETRKKRKKKKKKKKKQRDEIMEPTAEFLGKLVHQVMEHQESLQKKFVEVVERLDGERREREERWRNQELAHFERESEARVKEKEMAMSREAMIVSYLEKFTGETINFPFSK